LANVTGLSAFIMLDLPQQLDDYDSGFFGAAEQLLLPVFAELIRIMVCQINCIT
jgi:hypothetical protein